ncbi:hypothetical protein DFH11DRAFT_1219186 [Phellopilus nigrolimitatus]|nr:hypothetical protein DFH11DRAFT_1219186 [Phellopilus nigrolimitatus]
MCDAAHLLAQPKDDPRNGILIGRGIHEWMATGAYEFLPTPIRSLKSSDIHEDAEPDAYRLTIHAFVENSFTRQSYLHGLEQSGRLGVLSLSHTSSIYRFFVNTIRKVFIHEVQTKMEDRGQKRKGGKKWYMTRKVQEAFRREDRRAGYDHGAVEHIPQQGNGKSEGGSRICVKAAFNREGGIVVEWFVAGRSL